jgi:hypothetical protein
MTVTIHAIPVVYLVEIEFMIFFLMFQIGLGYVYSTFSFATRRL